MLKKMTRVIAGLIGLIIGFATYLNLSKVYTAMQFGNKTNQIIASIACGIITGIILFFIGHWIFRKLNKVAIILDQELSKYPLTDIVVGAIGLIIGLVIAYLISGVVNSIPYAGSIISILIYIILGYLGIRIATKNKKDILNVFKGRLRLGGSERPSKKTKNIPPKVLDTSVIIDGRIADICKTGFVEGKLVIPNFVLKELRHIADSSDDLKRVRGRRGLDILNMIQKEIDVPVEITDRDFPDINEVDLKLLKLAEVLNGKVVTNDFNLNKVAQVQGVEVLNINELANAVKPVAIPGENMIVQVIKEGKENNQGVAYLDDGTMIVIEDGKKYIGRTIEVLVTSILQTPAGRMIFVKPKKD